MEAFRSKSNLIASTALAIIVALSGCSGGGGDSSQGSISVGGSQPSPPATPPAPPPPPSSSTTLMIDDAAEAVRFLATASFGATKQDIQRAEGQSASTWLQTEIQKPPTLFLADVLADVDAQGDLTNDTDSAFYWDKIITADDQLRQRMVFALSQIVVVSDQVVPNDDFQHQFAYYRDILSKNAFGNYRDLLKDVTYSPAMAEWLTYLKNEKGDPETGRMPDENYARELLQLFTIGLVELNLDGTVKLDAQGNEIELFDNEDIVGLARVFTGLSYSGGEFFRSGRGSVPFASHSSPLQVFPEKHSDLEKSFLGLKISAGTSAEDSIDQAIDHIFEHPNVGPFLSRQLIQRFTASNPSPDYVERVATAFNDGSFTSKDDVQFGGGVRGDLTATLAAILLDESLYDDVASPTDGKIQEPVLRFVHWARLFNVSNVDALNTFVLKDTSDPTNGFAMHPFRSPSVFNFYRPGYIAPGTETGDAGVTAPEFQIINASSLYGNFNTLSSFAFGQANRQVDLARSFVPNYTDELALAYDETALVDHLDTVLVGGRLSAEEKNEFVAILSELDARTDSSENENDDRFDRVALAVSMVLSTPSYILVQR